MGHLPKDGSDHGASARFARHSSVDSLVDRRRFATVLGELRRTIRRVPQDASPDQRLSAYVGALRGLFPSVRFAIRISRRFSPSARVVQHTSHSIAPRSGTEFEVTEAGLVLSGAESPWPEGPDFRVQRTYRLGLTTGENARTSDGFDCAVWSGRTLAGVIQCEFNTSEALPPFVHETVATAAFQLGASLETHDLNAEMQHLRDYLDRVLEHANIPVLVLGKDRTVRVASGALERVTGIHPDAIVGRDLLQFVPENARMKLLARVANVLEGKTEAPFQLSLWAKASNDSKVAPEANLEITMLPVVDAPGSVGGLIAIGRDLSEVRALEDQVIQAEKLATLGQLAAGIVHEINNPLTSISVYGEYLLTKMREDGSDETDVQRMQRILQAADRIMHFSRNVLAYARPSNERPGPVIVADALNEALDFCQHVLREARVEVTRLYASDVPVVNAVRSQLHQVFVNLLTNACNAMPEEGGTISARITDTADGRVLISLQDTGVGMSAPQLSQVFEPFYSTRLKGKGTGLGLPIVRNIVEQHGGAIDVDSELGSGTTVSVWLSRIL